MAVNPNANPIFDLPGSAPRFEFGDGPTKQEDRGGSRSSSSNNVKSKKGKLRFGKKFGKSSKNKNGAGCDHNKNGNNDNCGNDVSTMSSGSATATTSPNSSLDSSFGEQHDAAPASPTNGIPTEATTSSSPSSPQRGNNNWSHCTPKKQRAPEKKNNSPSTLRALSSSPPSPLRPSSYRHSPPSSSYSPGGGGGGMGTGTGCGGGSVHRRNVSTASTSGYISEVSEFSFDRVTVTTNETGSHTNQSSNVSWNFVDDAVLEAVGGGQKEDGVQGDNGNWDDGNSYVPYMTQGEYLDAAVADDGGGGGGRQRRGRPHRSNRSHSTHSTFGNVSLSSDEDGDDAPFAGRILNGFDGAQSVISEISERTGAGTGALLEGGTPDSAVDALLREGMESARRRHAASSTTTRGKAAGGGSDTDGSSERRSDAAVVEGRSGRRGRGALAGSSKKRGGSDGGGVDGHTHTTARSTMSGSDDKHGGGSFFGDIRRTYDRFKTDRNGGQIEKSSILQSIVEDVQFCGLYFCGIDTTADGDGDSRTGDEKYDDLVKKKKEERKREADSTFLGKVIKCGNVYTFGNCVTL